MSTPERQGLIARIRQVRQGNALSGTRSSAAGPDDRAPGSRLELFDESGHFPHLDDPVHFARTLEQFLDDTEPAQIDTDTMREVVLDHDPGSAKVLERLQREHPVA